MAQQHDAIMGQFDQEFEDENAGVAGPEPEEAGPGVMGKIITTFSNMKERVSGHHSSTPTTPSGVETQQHENKIGENLDEVPKEEVLKDHPATDQVHKDAVSINTAGALEPARDGGEKSAVGGVSTEGTARSVEPSNSSPRGTGHSEGVPPSPAATPQVPPKDLGERIIDKLPFTHMNPYSVGSEEPPQTAANPYTEGDQSAAPATPSGQRTKAKSSSSLWKKLKNLISGQKASKGTATENATTATAGTSGEHQPLIGEYAQSPTPEKSGDLLDKAKQKFGNRGPDAGSAETWPSPSMPDLSSIPSATRTDADGKPIEGPKRPVEEDIKNEGLMSKLMDKFHNRGKSSSPKGKSTPTVSKDIPTEEARPSQETVSKDTPTEEARPSQETVSKDTPTEETRPSQETGIPLPSEGGPETTAGTATGPTEN
ncbi:unnamed protein product [Calypogeia fissa]